MTSYTELLKKQLLVQASDFFGVSVESFESKLKNPNSIESKAIAVFTSIIASKQLAEKLIAEAIAFIHQTEEKLGMNARRRSATPHDSQFSEQKEESNAHSNLSVTRVALAELITFIKNVEIQLQAITEQHDAQVQKLEAIYTEVAQNILASKLGLALVPSAIKAMRDEHTKTKEEKEEKINGLEKMGVVLPVALPALSLGRPGYQYPEKDLNAELKNRVSSNHDLAAQIRQFQQFRELTAAANIDPSKASLRNVLEATNVFTGLNNDHDDKLHRLNSAFEVIQASLLQSKETLNNRVSALQQLIENPLVLRPSTSAVRKQDEEPVTREKSNTNFFRP